MDFEAFGTVFALYKKRKSFTSLYYKEAGYRLNLN